MTYHPNTPRTETPGRPLSGDVGGNGFEPAHGSFVRLAPSAESVQDIGVGALAPGDLILSTTSNSDSAAIRSYTQSPVSHVAVYLGDGQVIEAIDQGVTVHSLRDALADDYYAAAYRVEGLNDESRAHLVRWLRTQEGRPYDVGALLSDFTDSDDAWFCSELAFAAFEQIGLPLTSIAPRDSQPGQILVLEGVRYLGHLKRPGQTVKMGMQPMARPTSGFDGLQDSGAFAPSEHDRDNMIPAGQYGMSVNADTLDIGDMIATSADGVVSETIRQHTNSPVSHLVLYVGDGMVVEAVGSGVEQHTLGRVLANTDYAAAYRMPDLTAAQRQQIKAFALAAVASNTPYDFRAIATLQRFNDPDALFCSELVFEAYASAGRPLGDATQSSPGQVITLSGIEYLGHLPARRDGYSGHSQSLQYAAPTSSVTAVDNAIQAAVEAGVSESVARAYFGETMARPMSTSQISLPAVQFLAGDSGLMAGIRAIASRAFPASSNPLDVLFEFCTRYNLCLAIGLHGSLPNGMLSNAGVSGGIVVAPNRRAGFYFSTSLGEGWVLEAAAGVQVVLISGGESKFNGQSYVVGGSIDFSEGPGIGFRVVIDTSGSPIGAVGEINFSLGVPGASAVEFTAALSHTSSYMTTLSVRSLGADEHPELIAAIQVALANGASEEEARAFLTGETHAQTHAYGRALSSNSLPAYHKITGWKRRVVEAIIDRAVPGFAQGSVSVSAILTALAQSKDVSIGIGVGANGGLGGSVSGGIGVVFLPNGDLARYGSFSLGVGWNFSINLTYDLTVINGDASVFYGDSLMVGGSVTADFGVSAGGGAYAVMTPDGTRTVGVIMQASVGLGLPVISTFEGGIQKVDTVALSQHPSFTQSRMIGGLPLQPPGRATAAAGAINVVEIPEDRRARHQPRPAYEKRDSYPRLQDRTWL